MSASKDKGTRAETAVGRYGESRGVELVRQPPRGVNDMGDFWGRIAGLGKVVIQVKDWKGMELAGWVDDAVAQAAAASAVIGVVWHKRPRKTSPGDWYVTMTGEDFTKLLEGQWDDR